MKGVSGLYGPVFGARARPRSVLQIRTPARRQTERARPHPVRDPSPTEFSPSDRALPSLRRRRSQRPPGQSGQANIQTVGRIPAPIPRREMGVLSGRLWRGRAGVVALRFPQRASIEQLPRSGANPLLNSPPQGGRKSPSPDRLESALQAIAFDWKKGFDGSRLRRGERIRAAAGPRAHVRVCREEMNESHHLRRPRAGGALAAAGAAGAKTLVYCSEGSPENFTPAINTTGTSFDAARPVYNRLTEFKRGTTEVVPGLAESWDITDGGKTITFHLRKGVKFHALKDFKPTRDFDADDVLWSIDRQWKPDHPYYKVSGGKYDYFNDMDMPAMLDSVDQDRRPHRGYEAQDAERGHPRQSGDGLHGDRVEGIRRLPLEEGNAGAVRSGAGRHRPVLLRRLSEGLGDPLQGQRGLLRREAAGRRPRLRHHARRDRALRQAQGRRMPPQRLSAARRPRRDGEGSCPSKSFTPPGSTSPTGRSTT